VAAAPDSDPREALAAAQAERAAIEAELDVLHARVAQAREEVDERERGLNALSQLELPGRSAILQFGMALPLINLGRGLLDGAPFLIALCSVPVLGLLGMAARRLVAERRLAVRVARAPRPTRVSVPPAVGATEDEERAAAASARR
jgi:hypothetical protein